MAIKPRTYDIFHGDIAKMIKYLENGKKKLDGYDDRVLNKCRDIYLQYVRQEAQKIHKYDIKYAYLNDNAVERTANGMRIYNVNEQATYGEFGTGIVGANSEKHPTNATWEHDVNGHGTKGWVYMTESGYRWTKGEPAHKVYWIASQRLKKRLARIMKEEIERAGR